jgi:hypothetical protein
MYVEKAAKTTFVRKTRVYNVDEIDTKLLSIRRNDSCWSQLIVLDIKKERKYNYQVGLDGKVNVGQKPKIEWCGKTNKWERENVEPFFGSTNRGKIKLVCFF